jgi:hypothetical protein
MTCRSSGSLLAGGGPSSASRCSSSWVAMPSVLPPPRLALQPAQPPQSSLTGKAMTGREGLGRAGSDLRCSYLFACARWRGPVSCNRDTSRRPRPACPSRMRAEPADTSRCTATIGAVAAARDSKSRAAAPVYEREYSVGIFDGQSRRPPAKTKGFSLGSALGSLRGQREVRLWLVPPAL